jgi:hypothetical protein
MISCREHRLCVDYGRQGGFQIPCRGRELCICYGDPEHVSRVTTVSLYVFMNWFPNKLRNVFITLLCRSRIQTTALGLLFWIKSLIAKVSLLKTDLYHFHLQAVTINKNKLHGLSPRANYTDKATAACRLS